MWSNKEAEFFPEIKKSFTFPGMGHMAIATSDSGDTIKMATFYKILITRTSSRMISRSQIIETRAHVEDRGKWVYFPPELEGAGYVFNHFDIRRQACAFAGRLLKKQYICRVTILDFIYIYDSS